MFCKLSILHDNVGHRAKVKRLEVAVFAVGYTFWVDVVRWYPKERLWRFALSQSRVSVV